MRLFWVLLKKEFRGFKGNRKNIVSTIVGAVTVLAIMAMFVFLFAELDVRFNELGIAEQFLSLFILAILVLAVVFSVGRANNLMFSDKDASILTPLPLDPRLVVLCKAVALFIYELITVAAYSLPIFIAYGIIGSFGALFYIKAIFCVIVLALAATVISALISPLYNGVKKFLLRNGILFFVVSLVFVGGLFFAYKYVLDIIIELIRNGRLQFIFNSSAVEAIRRVSSFLLFSSSVAMFLSGSVLWRIFVCLLVVALLAVGSYFLLVKLYGNVGRSNSVSVKKGRNKRRSVVGALVFKEINELIRSPMYMFSYLSVALSLPMLTYLTMGVLSEVVSQLLTASFVAPFALMVVVMYSMVSNTFAGDAVSREGNKLAIVKTIPVEFKLQVGIKLLLSLFIAFFALVLTVIVMVASGMVDFLSGLIILVIAMMSTAASVISMINNDLRLMDPEKNTAFSVVKSFIYAIFMGLLAGVFCFMFSDVGSSIIAFVLPLCLAGLYLALMTVRYFKIIKRKVAI